MQVHADQVVGEPDAEGAVEFSDTQVGRVRLERVTIRNGGGGGASGPPANGRRTPCHWKRDVPRAAACRIVLHGRSEFVARGVVIDGDVRFEVPDGQCWEVRPTAASSGKHSHVHSHRGGVTGASLGTRMDRG